MIVFAVPYNPKNINAAFIAAFSNMSVIFSRLGVELIIIDCTFDDKEHLQAKVNAVLWWVDGIIFPGNPYSIDPRLYGEEPLHPERVDKEPKNYQFAECMIKEATKKELPILGICAGAWYINLACGGALRQEVIPFSKGGVAHDIDPRDGRVVHDIEVLPDTLLADALGSSHTKVNSWHDQSIALSKLGKGLRVSAISPDGEVEAIEGIDDKFCMGIQFHPEFLLKGDVEKGYLLVPEIIKQKQIFSKMVQIAKDKKASHIDSSTPMWKSSLEMEQRKFLAFHQSNTERLVNRYEGFGKLQLR